jgi:hypothetical protein
MLEASDPLRDQVWCELSDADSNVRYWLEETAQEHRRRNKWQTIYILIGSSSFAALLAEIGRPWTAIASTLLAFVGAWMYSQAVSERPRRIQTVCSQWLTIQAKLKNLWLTCNAPNSDRAHVQVQLAELISTRAMIEAGESEYGVRQTRFKLAQEQSDQVLSISAANDTKEAS